MKQDVTYMLWVANTAVPGIYFIDVKMPGVLHRVPTIARFDGTHWWRATEPGEEYPYEILEVVRLLSEV